MSQYIWEIDIDEYLAEVSLEDSLSSVLDSALKEKFNQTKEEITQCLLSNSICLEKIKFVMKRELLLNFILFEFTCGFREELGDFEQLFLKEKTTTYIESNTEQLFDYEKLLIINQI